MPIAAEIPSHPVLLRRLDHLMSVERIYRQEGLTITTLAAKLYLPEHRLRQVINEGLGHRNFNAFLNRYRIDEAKAALSDLSQRDVPVLTIAMDAGFQSIGPFNRAFKADTGLTPTEFRRHALAGASIASKRRCCFRNRPVGSEKSASRIQDPARTDLRCLADCSIIRFLIVLVAGAPMTNVEQKPERLHALDALRGYALLLGIVLHATLSFLPSPSRIWIIQDSQPSITLGVLFFSIHVFRMTTFFLIAGFFAHLSFHRRGTWGFIKDRLQRIALPLVVGWPILFTAMAMVFILGRQFSQLRAPTRPATLAAGAATIPAHAIFGFSMSCWNSTSPCWCCASAWSGSTQTGRIRARLDRLIGLVMQSRLAPAILALPIGIAFSLDPTWIGWLGVRTPDSSLVTNLQALIGFGTAFGFGWLLHRQIDLIRMLERRWLLNSRARGRPDCREFLPRLATVMQPQPIGYSAIKLTARPAMPRHLDHDLCCDRRCPAFPVRLQCHVRRYLADASYWLYLIHLPILMALQVAVSHLYWPWPVKFVDDFADRAASNARQLPVSGALQLPRRGAQRPARAPRRTARAHSGRRLRCLMRRRCRPLVLWMRSLTPSDDKHAFGLRSAVS